MTGNFINIKSKYFTIFLFSAISFVVFILSAQFAVTVSSKWYGLIVGGVLTLSAIPLHIFAKKRPYLYMLSFLINFVGCGFSVSPCYLGPPVYISSLLVSALPALGVCVLAFFGVKIFARGKRKFLFFEVFLNGSMLIVWLIFWIRTGNVFFSFGFFCLIISLLFIFVFLASAKNNNRSVLRNISFGSFGAFLIITVIVIIILSEGDFFDISDFGIGEQRTKKNSKK